MDFWERYGKPHLIILGLLLLYFLIHLTNLTLLPIFNDESIYLDWAWSYTHMPGHLYDSLLDAKQPLLIWIFAVFENFFDPLFAGRFVAVLIGGATMIGIYFLAKKILNKQIAVLAALIYTATPIFVFYNRQALMEVAVACIGVWIGIVLNDFLRNNSTKNSILLGALWGTGFFIKSTIMLFVLSAMALIWLDIIKKKKIALVKPFFIALGIFLCVDFLLFINPVFWQTLSLNNRYIFTVSELFTFPFQTWFNSIYGFVDIGFVFVTPLLFLAGLVGSYFLLRDGNRAAKLVMVYFLFALFLELFLGKNQSQRYLVAFLPFLVIPAAYIFSLLWKRSFVGKAFVIIASVVPLLLSLQLLFQPVQHIKQTGSISKFGQHVYIEGQTSGYGVMESIQYIKDHSQANQPVMVLFGFNIGNPESAVDLYAQKTRNLAPLHMDSKMFDGINEYDCLTSQYPTFFVTRNGELLGMERYFSLEKSFPTPDKRYAIKVYTLKKDCKGKTASLSDIYHGSMLKMFQMRNGGE